MNLKPVHRKLFGQKVSIYGAVADKSEVDFKNPCQTQSIW